jgi:predicted O-linked N-acetylglucosamine transferase (SPINDLY family)
MPTPLPAVTPLPARHRGFITFGSLHRLNKLTPQTLDLWSSVLQRVPTSRLIVFWPTLRGDHRTQLQLEFQQRGIAADRIELRHQTGPGGYLAQYHEIDIALDVTPWTGSTTTREALMMGTVVLALCGQRRSARGSATVLHHAGLHQYIAYSPSEYVELAWHTAQRIDELDQLRNNLRQQIQLTIGDHPTQMRQIERAFREAWVSWCQRQAPQVISGT